MRRWQTIFRTIRAIYLGILNQFHWFPFYISMFWYWKFCWIVQSHEQRYNLQWKRLLTTEKVLKKGHGWSDQRKIEQNLVSIFSFVHFILRIFFRKKFPSISSCHLWRFFRDWPYLYAYLPSIHVYLQWIISQSIHRCLAASCFRLSILPLTYCDSQTIMNRSSILSVVWWHMRVHIEIENLLTMIWHKFEYHFREKSFERRISSTFRHLGTRLKTFVSPQHNRTE